MDLSGTAPIFYVTDFAINWLLGGMILSSIKEQENVSIKD